MPQHAVDQEPIRIHAALLESGEIGFERFSESLRQRLARLQYVENVFERFIIESVPGDFSLQTAQHRARSAA